MPQQNDAPYGSKKQLADLGLGQKEMPTTGAVRAVRPTGRPPAGPAGLPAQAAAPASPQGPTDVEKQLMHLYAEAQLSVQWAQQLSKSPGSGQWAQFYAAIAPIVRDQAALALHQGTPNWTIQE